MKWIKVAIPPLFVSSVIACSAENEQTNVAPESEVILERQLKALDDARAVEGILFDADENRRKMMDEQGI